MSQGEGSREGAVRVRVRVGDGDGLMEGFREGGGDGLVRDRVRRW